MPGAAGARLGFRVGIHQGGIIRRGRQIFSDSVNVAARLEGLAERAASASRRVFRRMWQAAEASPSRASTSGGQERRAIGTAPGSRPEESPLPHPSPPAGEGSARSARIGPEPLALPDRSP